MKTIIRNFMSVLRRYKLAAALNVLGLSVAFAAFMVIMMQVDYERTFDRCHPNAGRIYRADCAEEGRGTRTILPRAMVDAVIASSAHIEEGTLIHPYIGKLRIVAGDSTAGRGFIEPFAVCYPSITRVFGFKFTEGSGACLDEPDKVIIPQSMARRMFGKEKATGQMIRPSEPLNLKDTQTWTVGGVYNDFPGNTQLENAIYTSIGKRFAGEWNGSNFNCYLLFDSPELATSFESDINKVFDFSQFRNPEQQRIRLMPLGDIYFSKTGQKTGDERTTRVLFFIALLVIGIAAINFTNFNIALAPMRIRSINTQKILGSSTWALRRAMVGEALAVVSAAWLVAMLVVQFLSDYHLLPFIDANTSLLKNLPQALLTAGVALLTGLVAGLYPAWYTTSFQPALILKGNFALSRAGRSFRNGLVGFQYMVSSGLIIVACFIQLQSQYMKNYDGGFDKEQIAIVDIGKDIFNRHKEAYISRMEEYPGVEGVAFSYQKLGANDSYYSFPLEYNGESFEGDMLYVSPNFLQVMGIPVQEGRDFLASDVSLSSNPPVIINQTMHESQKIGLGATVESFDKARQVVGVTGGLKFTSLRKHAEHVVLTVEPDIPSRYSYVRLKAGANIPEAVKHIREAVASIDPVYPVNIEFYDEVFNRLYHKEENLNKSITLLSVLAIIISIVGVFGLVLFETEYRKKEISIRKVHGASVGNILAMFNKVYFRIVCACFILATPIAWYAVTKWLENFAYKTPLHWWVFALSFATVALITAATVTFQNWRAANMNPAEAINN